MNTQYMLCQVVYNTASQKLLIFFLNISQHFMKRYMVLKQKDYKSILLLPSEIFRPIEKHLIS